jgi:hypothetical protein
MTKSGKWRVDNGIVDNGRVDNGKVDNGKEWIMASG